MSNIIYANVMDLINKSHTVESYNNEIWLIFIIIILLFIYNYKSLIFQYIMTICILFLYSPIYGITYANLIFFIYNFFLLFNLNNFYIKLVLFLNIFTALVILLLKILNINCSFYITVPIINIFSILSNLYFLFYVSKIFFNV